MVKKLQKIAEKKSAAAGLGGLGNLLDGPLAGNVRESAQQIWLAGLGAFNKAQGEGTKLFDQLVQQGMAMQRKTLAAAEERIGEVANKMTGLANDVGSKAGQHWDKLETIFEERVSKALNKLGVPSSKDVQALIDRIDALTAQVAKLSGAKPAARGAARTAATKTAAKSRVKPAAGNGAAVQKAPARRARKAAA